MPDRKVGPSAGMVVIGTSAEAIASTFGALNHNRPT